MRFLVDECLSTRVPALLVAAGHDAVHVVDCGLAGDQSAVALVSVLLANLDTVAEELERGAFVVIAEKRMRIRGLPLR